MKPKLTKIRSISIVLMVLAAIFILIVVGVEAGKPFEQPARVGDSAPDFTLQTDSGKKVSLHDFKGKVVLLSFGTTWCEACHKEEPGLQDLYRIYKDRGLVVIRLDYRETSLVVSNFKEQKNYTFPFLIDQDGQTTTSTYGVIPFPTTILIDEKGIIRNRTEKVLTEEQVKQQLYPLLGS